MASQKRPLQISAIGAVYMAFSVGLGAFGAHGLNDILVANNRLATYETAMDYMFYHSLALLLIGLIYNSIDSKLKNRQNAVTACMIIGILVFSGSLITLSITGITWLGAITPIGGLSFIIGWALLALDLLKCSKG
jgi:uncharacterized membrane protein YgdD (TMEM256/DUF423 family)